MTITDALQLVPEYILLRPGVDKWREGEEYLSYDQVFKRIGVDFTKFGELVDAFTLYRRPIPQHVRKAMASLTVRVMNNYHVDDPDARKIAAWLLRSGGEV